MDLQNTEINPLPLKPFPYHERMRDYFKQRKKTWHWFDKKEVQTKQKEELKKELLKNTYRLMPADHSALYADVADICTQLNIDAKVTLYQANNSTQLNASISILEQDAHIVFSGPVLSLLSPEELKCLLAHELSHYLFYKTENEAFDTTNRIVLSLANDVDSEDSIIEAARIFLLYMELFCDAGSLMVCKNPLDVIRVLVKMETGLSTVNAESYLRQALDIINVDDESTLNHSHPESYIRSLAIKWRHEGIDDYFERLEKLIIGKLNIDRLDIFQQQDLHDWTRELLLLILKPNWMATSSTLTLAQQYFQDFNRKQTGKTLSDFQKKMESVETNVKSYFAYVLLDFARVDREMENLPLGYTLEIAEMIGLREVYEGIIKKEFKLTARDFKNWMETALSELQQVREGKDESLFNED